MSIGQRLSAIRAYFGLSQEAMSQRFGLGTGGWKRLEKAGRAPRDDALAVFVESGIDLNWLITGQGDMMQKKSLAREEVDETLNARIFDAVIELYQKCNLDLPTDAGEVAARIYTEIIAADLKDWNEKMVALRYALTQTRRKRGL